MGVLGISLIVASVVLFCLRRPAWFPGRLCTWPWPRRLGPPPERPLLGDGKEERGKKKNDTETEAKGEGSSTCGQASMFKPEQQEKTTATASNGATDLDLAAMPPSTFPLPLPPPLMAQMTIDEPPQTDWETTPKASAAQRDDPVPTFSLNGYGDPPNGAPSPPSTSSISDSKLMPPPPRPSPKPPTLSPLPANTSSSRLLPTPSRARQPGSSTLALPPSHSAKPAKPSRAVILSPGHSPLDWARLSSHPSSDLRNLPGGTSAPYLRVTPSMLKRQTGRRGKDAWMGLGGKVYNITPYLPFHPGGETELLRGAGRDGARLFGEVHPWVNYEGMLSACLVGIMVAEDEGEGSRNEMEEMD